MLWKNFRFSRSNFSKFVNHVSRLIREPVRRGSKLYCTENTSLCIELCFECPLICLYAGIGMLLNYNCNINIAIFFVFITILTKRMVGKQKKSPFKLLINAVRF